MLYGPSGCGKSFVALDLAMAVASGRSWHGRRVHSGPVVYVVAEDISGFALRAGAWAYANGTPTHPIYFLDVAVDVRDRKLVELVQALKPALIVLDPLARCFEGDENNVQHVTDFLEGCQSLQRCGQSAFLILHHTGKDGSGPERGSSAWRAAADTMIAQQRKKGAILLTINKQKNHEPSKPIGLRLKSVVLSTGVASCVLDVSELPHVAPSLGPDLKQGSMRVERVALQILAEQGELKSGEWKRYISEKSSGRLPDRPFHRYRHALVQAGHVEFSTAQTYRLTEAGKAVLSDFTGVPSLPSATTPLRGGCGGTDINGMEESE